MSYLSLISLTRLYARVLGATVKLVYVCWGGCISKFGAQKMKGSPANICLVRAVVLGMEQPRSSNQTLPHFKAQPRKSGLNWRVAGQLCPINNCTYWILALGRLEVVQLKCCADNRKKFYQRAPSNPSEGLR